MNTAIRKQAQPIDVVNLIALLRSKNMSGRQAALLIDELHDCIIDDKYMIHGSVDLNDIAHKMLNECDTFEEYENE